MCALQHPCRLGIAKEGERLIEHIACHNIRKDKRVSLSVDHRTNTFLMQAHGVERGLQIQRSVDDTTAELTRLGFCDDLQIIDSVGKGLGFGISAIATCVNT